MRQVLSGGARCLRSPSSLSRPPSPPLRTRPPATANAASPSSSNRLTSAASAAAGVSGEKAQERGYVVITMDNGDKAFVRFTGSGANAKDGATAGEGTWSYTGGTGKLRGLTGKGAYKSTGNADGATDHVEGDYTLPPPAPAKAKK